jgi:hypothetical protein
MKISLKKRSDTDPSSPNRAFDWQTGKTYTQFQRFRMPGEDRNTHSVLPGDSLANPFLKIHPKYLRKMYQMETDLKVKKLIWKALKQWARLYSDSLINPYKYDKYFNDIKNDYKYLDNVAEKISSKFAEFYPSRNLFYYQSGETNQYPNIDDGYLEPTVGDSDELHNRKLFVYPREYEQNRPENPSWGEGDFQTPYDGEINKDLDINRGAKMSFFDTFVWGEVENLDNLFNKNKKASMKKVSKIVKVADLENFTKIGENLLVHKSDKDLWAMETDDNGNIVISRLFEGDII